MKLVLAFACLLATTPALAAEGSPPAAPVRCDNEALMRSLARLSGGPTLRVVQTRDQVSLELVQGDALTPVVRASCDRLEVPFSEQLERPTKEARTRVLGGITLARTARGAISLDFAPGVLGREGVHMLVLDDDSLSITRGDKVFYAFATLPDGSTVESEGVGNGCGCERTTDPHGRVTRRALPR